jgi:hypothetical protein
MKVPNSKVLQIQGLNLSFHTARQLHGLVEMLPQGPEWKCKPWMTQVPTKVNIHLFYCDPLACIQVLLNNLLFNDHLAFQPMRVFETTAKTMCVYSKWMTGNVAWSMQVQFLIHQLYFILNHAIGTTTSWCDAH